MTHDTDQLITHSVLRDYRFESHAPIFGPLVARLRSAWYSAAARWGDQSIINQQTTYNQLITQRVIELEQSFAQRVVEVVELDQRLVQSDHDLTNLTRTVAELTQQVLELQHMIERAQAARSQS